MAYDIGHILYGAVDFTPMQHIMGYYSIFIIEWCRNPVYAVLAYLNHSYNL